MPGPQHPQVTKILHFLDHGLECKKPGEGRQFNWGLLLPQSAHRPVRLLPHSGAIDFDWTLFESPSFFIDRPPPASAPLPYSSSACTWAAFWDHNEMARLPE